VDEGGHALHVTSELTLSAATTGDVVVSSGGRLTVSGTVTGDLVVERGGRAQIDGQVRGALRCAGTAELAGVLQGPLLVEKHGTVLAATGASRYRDGKWLVMADGQWAADDGGPHTVTEATPRWRVSTDLLV
jgi:hypothetical protein